jgi:hypothetical protein
VLAPILAVVLAQVIPTPTPAATQAPTLGVSATGVNLNPAQQGVVTISGATPPLQATLDQRMVSVSIAPDGSSVTITAMQATGSDVLHLVDANGARADVGIRVAFNAGTIVPQTALTVTGNPADPDWLAQEVARWVKQLTKAQPGAQVTIGTVNPPPAPLASGQSTQLVVPVQIIGGAQYFDQFGSTTVNVQNVAAPPFEPGVLFYDDDPEHVTQDGVLFRGTVTPAMPARLYYYHDDGEDPHRLVVALTGNSQNPTSVQLVEAFAGPNMDVMHVGHTVTKKFLLIKMHDQGVIVNLPQDQPFVLADVPMASRQLVSGIVDVRVLSGGPVTATVLAVSGDTDPRSLLAGPVLPGDGHHRTGVFVVGGFGTSALNYPVGGPNATLVIGDTDPTPPNADPGTTGHDYGDYGVSHTIDLTLTNPGSAPATAYLYMKPLAGPARGSFLINGTLAEVGCVRVPTPYEIMAFDLAPGQTYRALVATMTDGASFYPVEIGVTATPPQPKAPTINAPDGCFPKAESSLTPK